MIILNQLEPKSRDLLRVYLIYCQMTLQTNHIAIASLTHRIRWISCKKLYALVCFQTKDGIKLESRSFRGNQQRSSAFWDPYLPRNSNSLRKMCALDLSYQGGAYLECSDRKKLFLDERPEAGCSSSTWFDINFGQMKKDQATYALLTSEPSKSMWGRPKEANCCVRSKQKRQNALEWYHPLFFIQMDLFSQPQAHR